MEFVVYILRCADGTFYVGSTNDIEKRVHAHNHRKSGAAYTKGRRPVVLVYKESFKTFTEARQKEYLLKQLPRKEKIELVKSK